MNLAPEEMKDFNFDLVSGSWFCPMSSLEGFWFLLRPVRKADRNRSDMGGRSRTREKSGWMNRLQDKSFYTPFDSWSGEVKLLDVGTPSPRSGVDSAGRGTTGLAPPEPSVATISFLGWLRPRRWIFGSERNFSGFMSSFDRWRWWDDKRSRLALLVAQIPFLADAKRRVGHRRDRHPQLRVSEMSCSTSPSTRKQPSLMSPPPSLRSQRFWPQVTTLAFSDATAAKWGPSVLSPPPATTASAIPSTNHSPHQTKP